jgi:hypothetical protein
LPRAFSQSVDHPFAAAWTTLYRQLDAIRYIPSDYVSYPPTIRLFPLLRRHSPTCRCSCWSSNSCHGFHTQQTGTVPTRLRFSHVRKTFHISTTERCVGTRPRDVVLKRAPEYMIEWGCEGFSRKGRLCLRHSYYRG